MGSSGSHGAGEMCLEGGGGGGVRVGRRNGGKKAAAAEQKVAKQPQRGLGVAQLEKIRLHNQMIAAYRSGMQPPPQQQPQEQQVPLAAAMAGAASFQPYLSTDCFEAMDRRIADVQYSQYCADNLLPYSSSRPPVTPLLVHEVSNSSSSAQRQQPPQYYWMSSSGHESSGRSTAGSTEELDLELRL